MAQVGNAMAGGLGALAGVMGFIWALVKICIWGMIGCFIGGATKKSAIGALAAPLKAADRLRYGTRRAGRETSLPFGTRARAPLSNVLHRGCSRLSWLYWE